MPDTIARGEDAGFVIRGKQDGTDYWPLVKACIERGIDQDELIRNFPAKPEIAVAADGATATLKPFVYTNPKRMVFRLDTEGRAFVLKRAYMRSIGLRRLFPRAMGTTYFTRIMKMVTAAVAAGCRATQDYFLVAEKWLSPLRQEIWILLEYVEGEGLGVRADIASRRDALESAVEELLRHDLTLDDLSPNNFIDSGERIRAIDISCRPFTRLQKAKMRLKMRRRYGLSLPAADGFDRAVEWALRLRYGVRRALGGKDM